MSINYYQMLQAQRPCHHRGKEIKESHIDQHSACCKGKEIVDKRKFFCKCLMREIVCTQSCECWACSRWDKE